MTYRTHRLFVAILILLPCLIGPRQGRAQVLRTISGQVVDSSGRVVPGAQVIAHTGTGDATAVADAGGRFTLAVPGNSTEVHIRAHAHDLESASLSVRPDAGPVQIVVSPSAALQQITVTATRSAIGTTEPANTAYVISTADLKQYPATALDDKLRQQAGFELFRRASSHVANPTSQGISLRGLGSTAVSRTLVLEEDVPLNDPFGGWIHWDEIPQDAISEVELATGGGSDLYGSSALGGVIDIVAARPSTGRFDLSQVGGGQGTTYSSLRGDLGNDTWRGLVASDLFRTAGYVPTAAPGPIDAAANVHYENGRTEFDHLNGNSNRAFLIGNVLNEARNNGTHLQTNGDRLWRYIAGDDWTRSPKLSARGRLFGSDEEYRQSFSAINATRTVETLTRLQQVHTQEMGASGDLSFSPATLTVVTGADARDIRGTDRESPIKAGMPNGLVDISARQRFVGGFGEVVGHRGGWSGALSLRLDSASNLDTRNDTLPTPGLVTTPNRNELILSPRLGLLRQVTSSLSLHASVFRAFRTPTMNELYRTGQVGQEITQANPDLLSERATGWEAGTEYLPANDLFRVQATYFWTEINRPVSAVLLSATPTTLLEKRENLGQIQSQGTELHLALAPEKHISGTLEYQYAHAVVTQFSAQPSLVGNWIPQVPRQSFTAQLRATSAAIGELTLAARASGRAYDDSSNTYVLSSFFELDLYAQHTFRRHWTASMMIQNLLNQRAEVARTPILTLGSPLLAQGGLAFHWGDHSL